MYNKIIQAVVFLLVFVERLTHCTTDHPTHIAAGENTPRTEFPPKKIWMTKPGQAVEFWNCIDSY